ncbi:MAG: hypothetical protein AMXMBFR84_30290 [Candidatus Hydrogenedentota bacterium]
MPPILRRYVNDAFFAWGIPVLWLVVTVSLVSPVAEFPLNDDWVYAKQVEYALDGQYPGHPFAAAISIAHAYFGAAFALLFGYSFSALRLSTLFSAVVTGWAVFASTRELGCRRSVAALATCTVLANPWFLNLSYTFMTDVPFVCTIVLSTFFYLRAIRTGHTSDLMWGGAFGALSTLTRQFGVMTFVTMVLVALVYRKRFKTPWTMQHALSFAAPWMWGAILGVGAMLLQNSEYEHMNVFGQTSMYIKFHMAWRMVLIVLLYAGLFVLPLVVGRWISVSTRREKLAVWQWLVIATYVILTWVYVSGVASNSFPLLANMVRDVGFGPLTLRGAYANISEWSPVTYGLSWRWGVTIAGYACGAILLVDFARRGWLGQWLRGKSGHRRPVLEVRGAQRMYLAVLAFLIAAAHYNPLLPIYFDRYLLPLVPLAAIFVAAGFARRAGYAALLPAAACCLAVYAFSLACLQDYMAWNRARWRGIDRLQREFGATVDQIDGGYEFNGMYTSDEFMRLHNTTSFQAQGDKGWWILDDEYAIAFMPRGGMEVIGEETYVSWLDGEEHDLLLLRRNPE